MFRNLSLRIYGTQIDFVYLDYRKRVYQKNGAGRVTYFDLVMLAEESLIKSSGRQKGGI